MKATTRLRAFCLAAAMSVVAVWPAFADQGARLTETQADSVLALARLYGVVRYFDPADAAQAIAWDRFLVEAADRASSIEKPGEIGPTLRAAFATLQSSVEIADREFVPDSTPSIAPEFVVEWRHLGLGLGQRVPQEAYRSWRTNRDQAPEGLDDDLKRAAGNADRPWVMLALGAGWHARVRVSMSNVEALVTPLQEATLRKLDVLPAWDPLSRVIDRPHALAAGIAAWAVARHFYPYWADVHVDWDAALREWARVQPPVQARADFRKELLRLLARMEDAHAGVTDNYAGVPQRALPIALRPLGNGYVVTASDAPGVIPGDVIVSINERPIEDIARENRELAPTGAHAKAWRARSGVIYGDNDAPARLGIDRGGETRTAELHYEKPREAAEKRPEAMAELRSGIRYIDLTRFDRAAFEKQLAEHAAAKAIIFDLRGYPAGDTIAIVQYWVGREEHVKWMHVPLFTRPYERPRLSADHSWDVKPRAELANARKILLIDPRAVSYGESITGYFSAYAKGTMIGEPTMGANGNVSNVALPGGFSFRFTGMFVTTHDGKTIQAKGFQPDIVVIPTPEDLRAGRDVVLERAIEIAQGR